jgi:predicted nucleic acid-binding protein
VTLVDTNVLLDFVTRDPVWLNSSRAAFVERAAAGRILFIDPVFAETSLAFPNAEECSRFFDNLGIEHCPMSRDALWRAAQAFRAYRRRGGLRSNVLVDFFVGAQAEVEKLPVLTRDAGRYATYFPRVELIVPAVE